MPELKSDDPATPTTTATTSLAPNLTTTTSNKIHITTNEKVTSSPTAPPVMYFTGHHAYIVNIAKKCRESELYTDVRILCHDGELSAHRLVLASCSAFLRDIFLSLPQGLPEFTLIIPNIKKQVVEKLIDFLYTGKMQLTKSNTYDLQQLVHILKIDPENVRIETPDESKQSRLVQSKLRLKPLVQASPKTSGNASPNSINSSPLRSTTSGPESPVMVNTVVESKAMPLRAAKRKKSIDEAPREAKVPSIIPLLTSSRESSISSSSSISVRGKSSLRRRGRPRQGNIGTRNINGSQPLISSLLSPSNEKASTGCHDLSNVNTWVCAICHQYDPVLPENVDPQDVINTEWVGCDCDRWFHQYCTGLKIVDDGFCCKMVKLKCIDKDD